MTDGALRSARADAGPAAASAAAQPAFFFAGRVTNKNAECSKAAPSATAASAAAQPAFFFAGRVTSKNADCRTVGGRAPANPTEGGSGD